ncbi:MAG: redoxin domain-containing protein [Candidatus Hydrogenedentes bacterium]|nr:redoxin domain-containing protein [Candidatus Hydrogenedentota bacterium]
MKNTTRVFAVAAVAATLLLAAAFLMKGAVRAEIQQAPEIGSVMPDFTLKDCKGNEHTLSKHKGNLIVLDFSSIECPYSRGVDPSLNALSETYSKQGVLFFGIDSHATATPEQILAYAKEAKIPHPILKDVGNAYADAVGAKVTPEIYVLDKELKLVYHGAPDNRKGPDSEATEHYLKDALDALLKGEPIKVTTNRAWGCGIKRASR